MLNILVHWQTQNPNPHEQNKLYNICLLYDYFNTGHIVNLIEIENNIIERSLAVSSLNVHWQYIVGLGKRPIRVLYEKYWYFYYDRCCTKTVS